MPWPKFHHAGGPFFDPMVFFIGASAAAPACFSRRVFPADATAPSTTTLSKRVML